MKKLLPLALLLLASCNGKIDQTTITAGEAISLSVKDLQTISEITRSTLTPLSSLEKKYVGAEGLAIEIPFDAAEDAGKKLRELYSPKGYQIFLARSNFGDNTKPNTLALIKSDDPYDILRIQQTNFIDNGLTTEKLIGTFKKLEETYQFRFTFLAAESSWVEAAFSTVPAPLDAFIQELVLLSPELLNDGSGKIEDIHLAIKNNKKIYLFFY